MSRYLLDTSVVNRATRSLVSERLAPHPLLFIALPTVFEVGHQARNTDEYKRLMRRLDEGYLTLWSSVESQERAMEVQSMLVRRGQHRGPQFFDLLIAAMAEVEGLTVLHYDRDFETIAEATGQPVEWVVPAGSIS